MLVRERGLDEGLDKPGVGRSPHTNRQSIMASTARTEKMRLTHYLPFRMVAGCATGSVRLSRHPYLKDEGLSLYPTYFVEKKPT